MAAASTPFDYVWWGMTIYVAALNDGKQPEVAEIRRVVAAMRSERGHGTSADVAAAVLWRNLDRPDRGTSLHMACVTDKAPGAHVLTELLSLLPLGADVDVPAAKGNTPLHTAAMHLTLDPDATGVKALLARGADARRTNDDGLSPLDRAKEAGNTAAVDAIVHHIGGEVEKSGGLFRRKGKQVVAAVRWTHTHVPAAFPPGAGSFDAGYAGRAMYSVCLNNATQPVLGDVMHVVAGMRRHGGTDADVAAAVLFRNADREDKGTALHMACVTDKAPRARVVCYLLSLLPLGAYVDVLAANDNTPLHTAALHLTQDREETAVVALLARGCSAVARNADGDTPLDRARRARNVTAVAAIESHLSAPPEHQFGHAHAPQAFPGTRAWAELEASVAADSGHSGGHAAGAAEGAFGSGAVAVPLDDDAHAPVSASDRAGSGAGAGAGAGAVSTLRRVVASAPPAPPAPAVSHTRDAAPSAAELAERLAAAEARAAAAEAAAERAAEAARKSASDAHSGGASGGAEAPECCVCFDNVPDTAFLCGHVVCGACAGKLTECPTCRTHITHRVKLYQ